MVWGWGNRGCSLQIRHGKFQTGCVSIHQRLPVDEANVWSVDSACPTSSVDERSDVNDNVEFSGAESDVAGGLAIGLRKDGVERVVLSVEQEVGMKSLERAAAELEVCFAGAAELGGET